MIALGVQTWSTDVAAVARFWRAADELGYARITYGDAGGWLGGLVRDAGRFRRGMLERFARDVLPRLATPAAVAAVPGPGDGQAGSAA